MTAEDFHKLADAAAPTSAQSLEARETRWKLFDAVFTERQRIHRALLLLEGVEKLHQAVTMTDGEQRIAVCTHCCELDYKTSSHCADKHQHGPGKPICATAALLDAASKEMETRP